MEAEKKQTKNNGAVLRTTLSVATPRLHLRCIAVVRLLARRSCLIPLLRVVLPVVPVADFLVFVLIERACSYGSDSGRHCPLFVLVAGDDESKGKGELGCVVAVCLDLICRAVLAFVNDRGACGRAVACAVLWFALRSCARVVWLLCFVTLSSHHSVSRWLRACAVCPLCRATLPLAFCALPPSCWPAAVWRGLLVSLVRACCALRRVCLRVDVFCLLRASMGGHLLLMPVCFSRTANLRVVSCRHQASG